MFYPVYNKDELATSEILVIITKMNAVAEGWEGAASRDWLLSDSNLDHRSLVDFGSIKDAETISYILYSIYHIRDSDKYTVERLVQGKRFW